MKNQALMAVLTRFNHD